MTMNKTCFVMAFPLKMIQSRIPLEGGVRRLNEVVTLHGCDSITAWPPTESVAWRLCASPSSPHAGRRMLGNPLPIRASCDRNLTIAAWCR
ncbi:hypothetical protein [Rhizobium lentis]|uniref:hypothetical protein n=1 Tax=Rhizobium lentis TaxID=1138194 RepID=UPI001A9141F6|nr:hypothetical protein [Rhizobium lentis]MBX5064741.1 hypothetical protein [Rhizobium lentis]MBX5079571.1 hypothetical protein [Rhizobium lentis]QSW96706.1 hypothetical protein J0663_26335 [Rhizobium lentis]